jgi:F-type H+-transporting ATPase subunit delta
LSAKNSVLAHIARPYASALFELAGEASDVEGVEAGLDQVSALIDESADFRAFLRSPVIAAEQKQAAVEAMIGKGLASGLVANFLKLVAHNRRLFALSTMIAGFKEMAAAARGEIRAEVVSATALTDKQEAALSAEIKRKIGKSVTLDISVDASLIGGLIVKVGSQMIDSSLKTKLTAMRIAMKEVG